MTIGNQQLSIKQLLALRQIERAVTNKIGHDDLKAHLSEVERNINDKGNKFSQTVRSITHLLPADMQSTLGVSKSRSPSPTHSTQSAKSDTTGYNTNRVHVSRLTASKSESVPSSPTSRGREYTRDHQPPRLRRPHSAPPVSRMSNLKREAYENRLKNAISKSTNHYSKNDGDAEIKVLRQDLGTRTFYDIANSLHPDSNTRPVGDKVKMKTQIKKLDNLLEKLQTDLAQTSGSHVSAVNNRRQQHRTQTIAG